MDERLPIFLGLFAWFISAVMLAIKHYAKVREKFMELEHQTQLLSNELKMTDREKAPLMCTNIKIVPAKEETKAVTLSPLAKVKAGRLAKERENGTPRKPYMWMEDDD